VQMAWTKNSTWGVHSCGTERINEFQNYL